MEDPMCTKVERRRPDAEPGGAWGFFKYVQDNAVGNSQYFQSSLRDWFR
jgi:hypothetical protein